VLSLLIFIALHAARACQHHIFVCCIKITRTLHWFIESFLLFLTQPNSLAHNNPCRRPAVLHEGIRTHPQKSFVGHVTPTSPKTFRGTWVKRTKPTLGKTTMKLSGFARMSSLSTHTHPNPTPPSRWFTLIAVISRPPSSSESLRLCVSQRQVSTGRRWAECRSRWAT
jgi:hypothetical protein